MEFDVFYIFFKLKFSLNFKYSFFSFINSFDFLLIEKNFNYNKFINEIFYSINSN